MERWTNNRLLLAGICLAVLVGALYFRFDPDSCPFPRCPFLTLTGFKCPGCGSQRALHHLLHGEVAAAGSSNFLFVIALPYLLFGLVVEYSTWGRKQFALRRRWYGYRASVCAFAVVSLYWIARNCWGF
ncbi:MAG: DUF2752 domain-containing protein [Saprospiraceae bacterium]